MNRLRSIAFTAAIAILALFMTVLFSPLMLAGKRAARRVIAIWARGALWLMRVIAGTDYHIEGRENIPDGGALVAANHQSLWETIALYVLLPNPVIILKKELLKIPVYGWWARLSGNIVVDREGGAQQLRTMREAAAAAIAEGAQVVVFPEGTRLKPGETAPFQPGVAGVYRAAGAPCVPVAHDSGRFWAKLAGDLNPGTITMRFLEPIPPDLERRDFQSALKAAIDGGRPDRARPAMPAPEPKAAHG